MDLEYHRLRAIKVGVDIVRWVVVEQRPADTGKVGANKPSVAADHQSKSRIVSQTLKTAHWRIPRLRRNEMVRRVGCSLGAVARNIWDFGVVEDHAANILVAPEKPQAEAELDFSRGAQVDAPARVHAQWREDRRNPLP